jgi:hypothetical protein
MVRQSGFAMINVRDNREVNDFKLCGNNDLLYNVSRFYTSFCLLAAIGKKD